MIRRARPLLGTLVAIAADGDAVAVKAAFAAVERVHALMNFHSAQGDLARINAARGEPVAVDAWTREALEQALRVSKVTGGAFDVVVPGMGATFADVALEGGCVRLPRGARIDLGGIAKGFAVDRAIDALRDTGAHGGSVNAGGDLRFFGNWSGRIRVRAPGALDTSLALPRLRQRAFATSAGYFGSTLVDPRNGAATCLGWSVTVAAATCALADALAKAVALLGPLKSILAPFGATAFAVDGDGRLRAPAG